MSEDIHKWTDGRYTLMFDEHTFFVWDNEKEERMTALNVTKKLNEQQATNSALRTENNHLIDVIKEYAKKYEEQQATISALKEENRKLKNIHWY